MRRVKAPVLIPGCEVADAEGSARAQRALMLSPSVRAVACVSRQMVYTSCRND